MSSVLPEAMQSNNTPIKKEMLLNAYELTDTLLTKKYVTNLNSYEVLSIDDLQVNTLYRFVQVDRIVYNKDEKNNDKFLNIYHSLYSCGGSAILLFHSDGTNVDFYIGTKASDLNNLNVCDDVLKKTIRGNFPGTKIETILDSRAKRLLADVTGKEDANKVIASITCVPSLRHDSDTFEPSEFTQGIEKLFDSMRGEKFTLLVIADPVTANGMEQIRGGYEDLYGKLKPFSETELSFGKNESDSIGESLTKGITDSVTENVSSTKTSTTGHTINTSYADTNSKSGNLSIIVAGASKSSSKTTTHGNTDSWNQSDGTTKSDGKSFSKMLNFGKTDTKTSGTSESYQIHLTNRSVKTLLDKIDKQLDRLERCQNMGMWSFASYILADDQQTAQVAASTYQALMRGKESGCEMSAVTLWNNKADAQKVGFYLRNLRHPMLKLNTKEMVSITPASLISGEELTISAGWPQKSLPGVPVFDFAQFGREIICQDKNGNRKLALGKIYHMGEDSDISVTLDLDNLTAHTFITGSTGTGKSNVTYKLLQELSNKNIPWLVIEPAKGEYKTIFGGKSNVSVYGTNRTITPLLHINPFKFPSSIHVLEHIDRLIEIFNVCWPMYAAMPAVLKHAIEETYKACGWDLLESVNEEGEIYPTFADLLYQLNIVVDKLDFSDEVRSNYRGALVTRVQSLTNGINGLVFSEEKINDYQLFDQNVIIDLSRVASTETKALIMGILVMRLQEYRIAQGNINSKLFHITVIEEAHNLLKKATPSTGEGGDLAGKSVEMLANSIAEMRTFGEGFVIVDQAPNLLDTAVIRNTNTKISLRLPAEEDRVLVGRASGLSDIQMEELIKLPTGVAVVYQNNWLQPVLCHVDKAKPEKENYLYKPGTKNLGKDNSLSLKTELTCCLLGKLVGKPYLYSFADMKYKILDSEYPAVIKCGLIQLLRTRTNNLAEISPIIAALYPLPDEKTSQVIDMSIEQWNEYIVKRSKLGEVSLPVTIQLLALQCIIREKAVREGKFHETYEKWVSYMRGKQG